MKRGSTNFLRATVLIMGLIALGLCALILPAIYNGWTEEYPEAAYLQYPLLLVLSATVIPFFVALYQTLKLLDYVDKNTAFSEQSITALKNIKYCALTFGGLFALSMPAVYYIADQEDAPGLMVIGLVFTFAPIVVAVFVAVLQKLLQSARDIKSENDLTV